MSIKFSRLVLDRSRSKGTDLLVLLVLADYANESGISWPSVATLARTCRMTPRNLNLRLASLRELGEVEVEQNAGQAGSNLYRIAIPTPEAGYIPPLKPTSSPPEAGFPIPLKPASDKPPVNHQMNHQGESASKPASSCSGRKASKAMPLNDWLAQVAELGERPIPPDDPIRTYADKVGIPDDFMRLAWNVFRDRHLEVGSKTYADWRAAFRNYVKRGWLGLWYADDQGGYRLTTAGQQAQREMEAEQ